MNLKITLFILAYQYRYYERCLTIGGKDFSETLRTFDKNKTNKTIQNSWTVLHAASGEQFWSHRQLLNSKSVPTSAAEISRHVPPMFPAVRGALEELCNKHIETRGKKYGPLKIDSEWFFDIFCFSTFSDRERVPAESIGVLFCVRIRELGPGTHLASQRVWLSGATCRVHSCGSSCGVTALKGSEMICRQTYIFKKMACRMFPFEPIIGKPPVLAKWHEDYRLVTDCVKPIQLFLRPRELNPQHDATYATDTKLWVKPW